MVETTFVSQVTERHAYLWLKYPEIFGYNIVIQGSVDGYKGRFTIGCLSSEEKH